MFHKMPFILAVLIVVTLLLSPLLPLPVKQFLYAISLTVKSIIAFLLPVIIFSLLYKTMVGFARQATVMMALILICVCCSNFLSTYLSHFVGEWIYHFDLSLLTPNESKSLTPAFTLLIPSFIPNNKAMIAGILLGLISGLVYNYKALIIAERLNNLTAKLLVVFIYLIPIFVTGFIIKLQYDGVVETILKDYLKVFTVITFAQFGYILFIYFILNKFNVSKTLVCIKNILPAGIAGFSTMSSAAIIPLTIIGARNNAQNKELASLVIPATVNIHLVGDCFAIPIFAYAVMKSFEVAMPGSSIYLVFVLYFILAKFSVAAIPGGGIIVMLPILEKYLGLNSEMLSLITALYILFDPVITCANILGNSALAKLIDQIAKLK